MLEPSAMGRCKAGRACWADLGTKASAACVCRWWSERKKREEEEENEVEARIPKQTKTPKLNLRRDILESNQSKRKPQGYRA